MPPSRWAAQLEQRGRVTVDRAAQLAALKRAMRCPLTGAELGDMRAAKRHVCSRAYEECIQRTESDIVYIQDGSEGTTVIWSSRTL